MSWVFSVSYLIGMVFFVLGSGWVGGIGFLNWEGEGWLEKKKGRVNEGGMGRYGLGFFF